MRKAKVLIAVLAVFALTANLALAAKKAEAEKQETTVVQKISEPKTDIKNKLGLGFTSAGDMSLRLWMTNSLGLDMAASMRLGDGFGMGLGANLVFPLMENDAVAIYVAPGLGIGFTSETVANVTSTDIDFMFNVNLETEAFIVKNLLSVAGTFGMGIGISVNSVANVSTTDFIMTLGSAPAAIIVRLYI
ncbi:MAG TPA: hypothetical protein P5511_09255 [Candidatus Goldiibacteriota bacterium]|nr:hypothetical protein [Candidatus Goldiibacteriota bacterium]